MLTSSRKRRGRLPSPVASILIVVEGGAEVAVEVGEGQTRPPRLKTGGDRQEKRVQIHRRAVEEEVAGGDKSEVEDRVEGVGDDKSHLIRQQIRIRLPWRAAKFQRAKIQHHLLWNPNANAPYRTPAPLTKATVVVILLIPTPHRTRPLATRIRRCHYPRLYQSLPPSPPSLANQCVMPLSGRVGAEMALNADTLTLHVISTSRLVRVLLTK